MMTDRLRARLRALDRPEDPSPAFREALYQELARRADVAAPTDLPLTAPVQGRVAGRRRWLPLLAAAVIATSLAGGLAALSALPRDQACEPALAARLAEDAPNLDYSYTAEGVIDWDWASTSGGDLRLEGSHLAPDRTSERYLDGEHLALFGWRSTEAVRIGDERWVSVPFEGTEVRPWMAVEAVDVPVGFPNLAVLPLNRVAFLLAGSTEAPTPVDWTAVPAPDGGCSLTGTIVPSSTTPARRVLTVEVAGNADLPLSIHEEWFDVETAHGEWTHDVTWRFEPSDEALPIDPPASHLVQRTISLDDIGPRPTPGAIIDGTGSLVVDFAPADDIRGEVRVTILEIREDTAYDLVVAYPGTTFLAVHMRQEALQPSVGTQGTLGLRVVPSGGGYPISFPPPVIEGGPEPILGTHLDLARGETLEGWMHYVVPATGALDLETTTGTPLDAPTLVVRLRPPRDRQRRDRRRPLGGDRLSGFRSAVHDDP